MDERGGGGNGGRTGTLDSGLGIRRLRSHSVSDITGDSGLGPWLDELGLVRVGRVVTMVRGDAPARSGENHSFAIVSQALG